MGVLGPAPCATRWRTPSAATVGDDQAQLAAAMAGPGRSRPGARRAGSARAAGRGCCVPFRSARSWRWPSRSWWPTCSGRTWATTRRYPTDNARASEDGLHPLPPVAPSRPLRGVRPGAQHPAAAARPRRCATGSTTRAGTTTRSIDALRHGGGGPRQGRPSTSASRPPRRWRPPGAVRGMSLLSVADMIQDPSDPPSAAARPRAGLRRTATRACTATATPFPARSWSIARRWSREPTPRSQPR